jgi:thioredoxin reductase
MYVKHGCFVYLAEAVKKRVSIPVIAVGRIKHAQLADRIIKEGKADAVAIGRGLIADPQLPEKSRAGDFARIRPCIGCCLGCIHAVFQQEPGGCVVNPDVGREYLLAELDTVKDPKRILVTGTGPSGLAAARILAMRGHQVLVCEERGQIGGLVRLAALAPGRGEMMDVVNYLVKELERLGVEIRLNTALTETLIAAFETDAAVVATGSLPDLPIIKGLFQTEMALETVTDILDARAQTGDRVIVLGGGQAGLMVSDFLGERGIDVVVLNRGHHFAEALSAHDRYYLRERLKTHKCRLYKDVKVTKFLKDGVVFRSAGEEIRLDAFDTVVVAEKMTPIRKPLELFKSLDLPVHVIGDAKSPRNIMLAISEGEELGRNL